MKRIEIVDGKKICTKCEKQLPLDSFYKRKKSPSGRQPLCKDCEHAEQRFYSKKRYLANPEKVRKSRRLWAAAHPDKIRKYHLRAYGLTEERYNAILLAQENSCGICGANNPGGRGTWHIDHDHDCCSKKASACGKCIRGLLCGNCNLALGLLQDKPEIITKALLWVQK